MFVKTKDILVILLNCLKGFDQLLKRNRLRDDLLSQSLTTNSSISQMNMYFEILVSLFTM